MGTGKYRITKIPREWELNDRKITLKRVIRDHKVEYVDEEENSIDITNDYYKIISKNNSNFLGTSEQFIFKVNKMERNIENDCIIMGKYSEEKKKEILEKYEKICIKKIEVEISKKKKVVKYICRNFYENEKDILEKRLDISKKINKMFYNICKDMYDLKYKDYSEEKIYEIFQNKIELETLIELKEAFKQQEKGLETDRLLAISFNKKRSNILLKFIQEITKQDFENKERLKNWFSDGGKKYCKEIFRIYSEMSQKKKYSKLLGYKNKNISSIFDKKKTLQRRLKLGKYSKYDLKKYYQKDYKQKAIKELSEQKNLKEIKKYIDEIIDNKYKLKKLCERIESLLENFNDISIIIFQIKEHYRENVNKEEKIEKNEEKYILSQIHSYMKGRYKKILNITKNEKLNENNVKEKIREVFNYEELKRKTEKSIVNKINNYKIFKIKIENSNINSSDDLEILKAEETFLSKISTAISKVGYILNILLENKDEDIFEIKNAVHNLWKNPEIKNIVSKIYKLYPELKSQDDMLLKGMIFYIQGIRQQVLHPDKLSIKTKDQNGIIKIQHLIKEKENVIKDFEGKIKNNQFRDRSYNEEGIKKYFEKIKDEMPEYMIEKYESNGVFNIYRNNINDIGNLINNFDYGNNKCSYIFPKFYKIYKKMNLDDSLDEVQKNARKYLLQMIYYNYFQYQSEISFETRLYEEFIRNQENGKKKLESSYIIKKINMDTDTNNIEIEVLYKDIQKSEKTGKKLNVEWIEFIRFGFEKFLVDKKLEWINEKKLKYDKNNKLDKRDKDNLTQILSQKLEYRELEDILFPKTNISPNDSNFDYTMISFNNLCAFISITQFLDLREISNLIHDIKKYIQFREEKSSRYGIEVNKKYIKELNNIQTILKIMLEHKDRLTKKSYLESYEEEISIIFDNIPKKDIKDLKIEIKNKNNEIVEQSIYREGKEESNSWIMLYGIEQAKRNGTFEFFKDFFSTSKIQLVKCDIEKYKDLYNSRVNDQDIIDKYIRNNGNLEELCDTLEIDIRCVNENNLKYQYYKSMINGDILKRGYDFINDIYSHYLDWIRKIERDAEVYRVKNIIEKKLRHPIAHFDYFKKTDKSLLEFLNGFYEEFDYSIKYQRDLQNVINNIFEKYQVVREDGGPVVYFDKNENKLKISDNLVPKRHGKYPKIKLIHEKYVEFFKKLFEYKKQGS